MGRRRASALRRARAFVVATAVLGLVAGGIRVAASNADSPSVPEPPPAAPADANPAAAVATVKIPDSAYPYPSDAIFVAPNGDDGGVGSLGNPFATVGHALAVAPAGATIVLRAGVYRESLGTVIKRITLQPYPHEQAWLSGSVVVDGWTRTGNVWAHTGWTAQF